jgi:hypothetical protein
MDAAERIDGGPLTTEGSSFEETRLSLDECLKCIEMTADWLLSYPEKRGPDERKDMKGIDAMQVLGRDLMRALEGVGQDRVENATTESLTGLLDAARAAERWLLNRFRELNGSSTDSLAYWYFGAYATILCRSKRAMEEMLGLGAPDPRFLAIANGRRFGFLVAPLLADRKRERNR